MPPEDGIDRFRDEEDEDTPMHILPSYSHGVTLTKENIYTLQRECTVVGDYNDNAPDNVSNSKDVLTAPEKLNFGFQGINPWHQGGNFPARNSRPKMIFNIRVQHIQHF